MIEIVVGCIDEKMSIFDHPSYIVSRASRKSPLSNTDRGMTNSRPNNNRDATVPVGVARTLKGRGLLTTKTITKALALFAQNQS